MLKQRFHPFFAPRDTDMYIRVSCNCCGCTYCVLYARYRVLSPAESLAGLSHAQELNDRNFHMLKVIGTVVVSVKYSAFCSNYTLVY